MLVYEEVLLRCLEETAATAATGSGGRSEKHIEHMRHNITACLPLDQPIDITKFPNYRAQRKLTYKASLRELAYEIENIWVSDKDKLPSYHLATFGDNETAKGSLRNNANVQRISGVEIDHDSGSIRVRDAKRRLEQEGIVALIYTSANSSAENPRWHALVPTSKLLPVEDRNELVERLNAVFEGEIDQHASFTLSQAMFSGNVDGKEPVETQLVDGDYIDRLVHLPRLEKGKRSEKEGITRSRDESGSGELFRLARVWKNRGGDRNARWKDFLAAVQANPKAQDHVDREGDRALERAWERALDIADEFDDVPANENPPNSSNLSFLSPTDCELAEPPGYLLKGMIAPGTVDCIFGAPGAGKSLIAPHIGYAVAQGRSAFGMRTKAGRVLYVAAEDETGMKLRVRALKERHGDAPDFRLVAGCSDLMIENSADLRAVVDAVKEQQPVLIIIDTLAMAFPGLEEKEDFRMGRVVSVGDKLAKLGPAVIFVHHNTKDGGKTPRGHSSLNGRLDMGLYLQKGSDDIIRGQLTKNRNGPCDLNIAFRIDIRSFGTDEDGDPITAALVDELNPERQPVRLTPAEKAAFEILRDCFHGRASRCEWHEACMNEPKVTMARTKEGRRRAVDRVISQLFQKRQVFLDDGKCSTIDWGNDDDDLV